MENYVPSSSITLPNIAVDEKYVDGVLKAHRLTANEGYVMYDTSDETTEPAIDPETGDFIVDPETGLVVEVPVIYYYRQVTIPIRVPVENWTWIAVPESEVPADKIFGLTDPKPEVQSEAESEDI